MSKNKLNSKLDIMFIWIILLGFMLTISTAVISYLDKSVELKNGKITSKSFKGVFIIALIGAFMTLISNIDSLREKNKSSIISKKLNDSLMNANKALIQSQNLNTTLLLGQRDSTIRIIESQKKIIDVNDKLYGANMKVQSLQSEMTMKIERLHEQNEKLKNIATGGDSYLRMSLYEMENGRCMVWVQNVGKYPLLEVKMWYVDMGGWNKITSMEAALKLRESENNIISLGYVRPMGLLQFDDTAIKFDKKVGIYLIVHFIANNGYSTQIIRMKWVKNDWLTANKFILEGNRKPIYEIPKDYPALPDKDDTFNNYY